MTRLTCPRWMVTAVQRIKVTQSLSRSGMPIPPVKLCLATIALHVVDAFKVIIM